MAPKKKPSKINTARKNRKISIDAENVSSTAAAPARVARRPSVAQNRRASAASMARKRRNRTQLSPVSPKGTVKSPVSPGRGQISPGKTVRFKKTVWSREGDGAGEQARGPTAVAAMKPHFKRRTVDLKQLKGPAFGSHTIVDHEGVATVEDVARDIQPSQGPIKNNFQGTPNRLPPSSPRSLRYDSLPGIFSQYGQNPAISPFGTSNTAGTKRRRSSVPFLPQSSSPKRPRTSNSPSSSPLFPSPIDPMLDAFSKLEPGTIWPRPLTTSSASALIHSLSHTKPHPLSLQQISACFQINQSHLLRFSTQFFSFHLSKSARDAWPLHELSTTYLPLMLVTQYIADGSQYGWRNFFTNANSRVPLVYGIIAEFLKHHVYNATAFGLPDADVRELENMDREYLHFDAFLRTKKRAAMLKEMLAKKPVTMEKAVEGLVEELLVVLAPLVKTFVLNTHTQRFVEARGPEATKYTASLRTQLRGLVHNAVCSHYCIRLTGHDGTIIRIAPSTQKGTTYYATAPFNIVNKPMVKVTEHHKAHKDSDLKIKMVCSSRVEAFVPHGPDYETLAEVERVYRDRFKQPYPEERDIVGAADAEAEAEPVTTDPFDWNEVSQDIHETYLRKLEIDAETAKPPAGGRRRSVGSIEFLREFLWKHENELKENDGFLWPAWPRELVESERYRGGGKGLRNGKKDEEEEEVQRGAYVEVFSYLANHDVYVEWDADGKDKSAAADGDDNGHDKSSTATARKTRSSAPSPEPQDRTTPAQKSWDGRYTTPIPKSQRLSLMQAVQQARRAKADLMLDAQDVAVRTWNLANKYEGRIETGVVMGVLGVVGWRNGGGRMVFGVLAWLERMMREIRGGSRSKDAEEVLRLFLGEGVDGLMKLGRLSAAWVLSMMEYVMENVGKAVHSQGKS